MSSTSRPDAPVSPLHAHLGYWLRVVSNHVSHGFRAKVEAHGVTVAEWVVLRALLDHDGVRPIVLADQLGTTRGTVSKLVDRLAAKALVDVQADPHDRRAQVVSLTPAGRQLVPVLAALADQNDAETFGHLKADEQAALRATLLRLVERLGLREAAVE